MELGRMVGIPGTWGWVLDGRGWIMILVRAGMEGWICLMVSSLGEQETSRLYVGVG